MSGFKVNFSVNNQLATPSIHAAPFAQRPAAGQPGRVFIDTDSPSTGIYRDTGITWIQIAGTGGGGGTLQTVTDAGNTTTNDIAIGTSGAPSAPLDVHGAGVVAILQGTGTNDSFLQYNKGGSGKFKVGNVHNSGNDYFSVYNLQENSDAILVNISTNNVAIGGGTVSPSYRLDINGSLRSTGSAYLSTSGNVIGLGGTNTIANNNLTINQGATNKGIVITGPGTVFGSDTTGGTRIYNYANIVNNRQIVIGRTDDGLGTNIQVTGRSSAAIFGQNSSSGSIIDTELGGFVGSNLNLVVKGSTGNILIGTTGTDAGFKLDVNGNTRVQGNAVFKTANNTSSIQDLTSATTYSAIYLKQVTPSATNYTLATDSTTTILNYQTSGQLEFREGNATKWGIKNNTLTNNISINDVNVPLWITPSSTNGYGILISAVSSQNQNLIEFRNNASTTIAAFKSNAELVLGSNTLDSTAILQINSTTKGVKFPSMTTAQKNAIANTAGLVVFDTDLDKLCVNSGAGWETITSV